MRYVCTQCDAVYTEDLGKCPTDGGRLLPFKEEVDGLIGKEIAGRFLIKKKLGEGGMGAVYLAHQTSVDRDVALKVLKKEFQEDVTVVKRFFLEAKAASHLASPHTITIYDFDKTPDGLLYIAMEFLKGYDISDKIKKEGVLTLQDTVKILDKTCESLAEAHEKGIVHRDLKPENVYLADTGAEKEFVKVLDFGIASAQDLTGTKLTRTGFVQGTPSYMCPEAIMGEKVNAAADVYALGIMMYEMLSGVVPFAAETPMQVMMAHMQNEPEPVEAVNPNVSIPVSIHQFLWRCLAKQADDRPQNAGEFKEQMHEAMAHADDSGDEQMQPMFVTSTGMRGVTQAVDFGDPSKTSAVQSATPESTLDEIEAMTPRKSPLGFILGGVGLLALLTVVAVFVFSSGGSKQAGAAGQAGIAPPADVATQAPEPGVAKAGADATPAPEKVAVKAPPPEPKVAPPPPKVEYIALTVTSTPNGADVLVDGTKLGTTPLMYKLPKDKSDHKLVLKLDKYLDDASDFRADDDQLLNKQLKPDPAKQPKKPVRRKTTRKWRPKAKKKTGGSVDDLLLGPSKSKKKKKKKKAIEDLLD
jgi:serine/threonine protein kinase